MIHYSLVYTNNINKKDIDTDLDKYLCYDNKIHVRFRDFNEQQLLIGFERKLVYLLSYLVNYCYIPKLIGNYADREILSSFILSDDILDLTTSINQYMSDNNIEFKGLLIKPNYKRDSTNYKYFGDTDSRFFPLQIKNNLVETGNLQFFLDTFSIDLYNYLFNDNYIIWLHDKEFKINNKYEKRKLKKIQENDRSINLVKLW